MRSILTALLALAIIAAAHAQSPVHDDEAPLPCQSCAKWNREQPPFQIYGNTWYVGVRELGAMLITGAQGHILIDGALPQSAAIIRKNVEALGFQMRDIKLILNSHEHFDHAGGIAALQRMSGASVAASPAAARVLRAGVIGPDDPQYERKKPTRIPRVAQVRTVADGEVVRLGELALTANFTPGHTPGSTTWTWQSCEAGKCLDIVYADSLNAISTGDFRFLGDARRPDISASFMNSIARMAGLKCDIVIAVHPGLTDTMEKRAERRPEKNTFIDPAGCRTYAADAADRLERRLAREGSPDWEKTR